MATGLTGRDGAVRIGGSLIGKLRRWEKTDDKTTVDTGGFGDEWEYPRGVRKRGSGSAEGVFAVDDAAGQGAVEDAFDDNTVVVLDLQQETGSVESINAEISQVRKGTEYDGASTFAFQYVQQGPPITRASHA